MSIFAWTARTLLVLSLVAVLAPAVAQGQGIHLELDSAVLKAEPIPGFCSSWHEIYPNFCADRHQDGYHDIDGDGMLSVCDEIILDDEVHHIEWVGPTYWLDCDGDMIPDAAFEPQTGSGGNPVCNLWMKVWDDDNPPSFGDELHVEEWLDADGDREVSVCDFVSLSGLLYDNCHVVDVGVNIVVRPLGVSTEDSSWGTTKSQFGGSPDEDE